MNVYIAARFSRRPEANRLAQCLKQEGHMIVSRWVLPDSDHDVETGLSPQAKSSDRRRFAEEDLFDIDLCDWFIALMEDPRNDSRGGRHVEFGYALALNKKLTVIGPRETVFHHVDEVEYFPSYTSFFYSEFTIDTEKAIQWEEYILNG